MRKKSFLTLKLLTLPVNSNHGPVPSGFSLKVVLINVMACDRIKAIKCTDVHRPVGFLGRIWRKVTSVISGDKLCKEE